MSQVFDIHFRENDKVFTRTYCSYTQLEYKLEELITNYNEYYGTHISRKQLIVKNKQMDSLPIFFSKKFSNLHL